MTHRICLQCIKMPLLHLPIVKVFKRDNVRFTFYLFLYNKPQMFGVSFKLGLLTICASIIWYKNEYNVDFRQIFTTIITV